MKKKIHTKEKNTSSINGAGLEGYLQKNEIDAYLSRPDILSLREEKVGSVFELPGSGKNFPNGTLTAWAQRAASDLINGTS